MNTSIFNTKKSRVPAEAIIQIRAIGAPGLVEMQPHLSFIVPALNEAAYIGQAISSIHRAMDYGDRQ